MSALVTKYFPEAPAKPKKKKVVPAAASASNDELVAVMTAAVHKYRS
jgi:oxaloacetate decarboxylase gamma subunit